MNPNTNILSFTFHPKWILNIGLASMLVFSSTAYAQKNNNKKSEDAEKNNTAANSGIEARPLRRRNRSAVEAVVRRQLSEDEKEFVIFQAYNLYGVKRYGKIILPAEYDLIKRLDNHTTTYKKNTEHLYKTSQKGKFGLINGYGDILLENQYEDITTLKGWSLIFVQIDGKWGALSVKGNTLANSKSNNSQHNNTEANTLATLTMVIKPSLQSFNDNNAGLIKFSQNDKFGLLNDSGKIVVPAKFDSMDKFGKNNLAIVQLADKYGIINTKGEYVLQPIYDGIIPSPIRNGEMAQQGYNKNAYKVKKDNKYALFDLQGEQFTKFVFDEIYDQSYCQSAYIYMQNDKYGLLSNTSDIIVKAKFDVIGKPEFGSCHFKTGINGKFGYVTDQGELIAPKYAGIGHDSKTNYFYFMQNDKLGVLNPQGKQIVPAKFTDDDNLNSINLKPLSYIAKATAEDVKERKNQYNDLNIGDNIEKTTVVILIRENGKYGMLDHQGKTLFASQYDDIDYKGQLFVLTQGDKKGIAKINGDMIVPVTVMGDNNEYGLNLDLMDNTKLVFDGKAGILDYMGNWVIEPEKQEIDTLEIGYSIYFSKNRSYTSSNVSKKVLILINPTHRNRFRGDGQLPISRESISQTSYLSIDHS